MIYFINISRALLFAKRGINMINIVNIFLFEPILSKGAGLEKLGEFYENSVSSVLHTHNRLKGIH